MHARATIGFGFTSDWLKKWRENFEPITEWSNHKPKQFANYFRHSIENRPISSVHKSISTFLYLTDSAQQYFFRNLTPLSISFDCVDYSGIKKHDLFFFFCVCLLKVAVLCRLKHPCVVRLVGVSLHPLCFVLELAPHGSLATVIDELSVKREERAKQQDSSASNTRGCLLGRELSYKIAFQVLLWYLIHVNKRRCYLSDLLSF